MNEKDVLENLQLVSVIVPCYNSESTIKKTLQSLEKQTYKKFEVIIINDGSTDNTEKVVSEYSKITDLKIRYLKQENRGVSNARNHGLENSKGEFILFLDADDVYHQDFIKAMYSTLITKELDTVCSIYSRNDLSVLSATDLVSQNDILLCTQEQLMENYMLKTKNINLWSFIFRKEILEMYSIKFTPYIKYGEDREFTWKYMVHCKSAAVINKPLYGYCNNPSSVFNNVNWEKTDSLKSTIRIEEYLKKMACSYYPQFKHYMYDRTMWGVAKAFAHNGKKDLYSKLLKEYDVETSMKKMSKDASHILVKISAGLYRIHPQVFFSIVKLKR